MIRNHSGSRSPTHRRGMLLDAFGTLLTMASPAPLLCESLASEGHHHDLSACERAFRAEIAHYKAHHLRGVDEHSLAQLRRECAAVLASALGPDVPRPDRMTELLMGSIRLQADPAAPATLDALAQRGWRCAAVSNWDVSLTETLDALGLRARLDAVVTSAHVGRAKPDPSVFDAALRAIDVAPGDAVHCGDSVTEDVEGALAAGLGAVQLVRGAGPELAGVPSISTLFALPAVAEELAMRGGRGRD